MPSKRELWAGMAFFALAAGALVLFRRPFDVAGWAGVAGCVAFVVLACCGLVKSDLGVVKPGVGVRRQKIDDPTTPKLPRPIGDEPVEDVPIGDPSPDELRILETTIAALEAVGGLEHGEIDARSLWRAAQRLDPGRAIGIDEAVSSFAALHDDGHPRIGRLIFVPAHTDYDAPFSPRSQPARSPRSAMPCSRATSRSRCRRRAIRNGSGRLPDRGPHPDGELRISLEVSASRSHPGARALRKAGGSARSHLRRSRRPDTPLCRHPLRIVDGAEPSSPGGGRSLPRGLRFGNDSCLLRTSAARQADFNVTADAEAGLKL